MRLPDLASALLALSCLAPAVAHAQPETRGPLPIAEWDAGPVTPALVRVRVVYPSGAATAYPIVAVVHGNLRNGNVMMEMARDFASRGFVAIVPDMPCGVGGCNHDANATILGQLMDWTISESGRTGSMIAGRVDPSRRALVGHSWGGLNTFLAAARDAEIDAWVGLDPEEDAAMAAAAAASVTIPNAHLMAAIDGLCNGNWGSDIYAATAAPHLRLVVANSAHCDAEDPTDGICDLGCTAGDRATTPTFRRYAIAFVACALGTDASMAEWVGGSGFDADVAAGRLVSVMESGLDTMDCGGGTPGADGGVPSADAGTTDAGTADAGAASDAGAANAENTLAACMDGVDNDRNGFTDCVDFSCSRSTDSAILAYCATDGAVPGLDASADFDAGARLDAGTAGTDGGCGCRATGTAPSRAPLALALLGVMALGARRRRAR